MRDVREYARCDLTHHIEDERCAFTRLPSPFPSCLVAGRNDARRAGGRAQCDLTRTHPAGFTKFATDEVPRRRANVPGLGPRRNPLDERNPTTAVPDDLRAGERVELVRVGDAAVDVNPGDHGTVMHVDPLLIVVFDAGPIIGILPDLGDAVKRVGS